MDVSVRAKVYVGVWGRQGEGEGNCTHIVLAERERVSQRGGDRKRVRGITSQ